jgi:hypothetical protein
VTSGETVDVVLVVCPRCRVRECSGVVGRVVRDDRGHHRFVIEPTVDSAREGRFGDDQLLRSAEFVTFDFGDTRSGAAQSVDVACKHGRRLVARARLEREITLHRLDKGPRLFVSEPPAH